MIVTHPNREKAAVQATRAMVILLLLASAGLVLINTVAGWNVLEGVKAVQIGYILAYLVLAFFAGRWNRGVLPVASALAVLLAIFALVAGPAWFIHEKAYFAKPSLSPDLMGLLTLLIVPVQALLVTFAMRGFNQGWNVELEQHDPSASGDHSFAAPQPA
ncbi:MAG: hypothetical protein FWD42_03195 [Solirubrobacterales bacterium]|nr:hypothetical protein [Solirubrobacterales bacterium]